MNNNITEQQLDTLKEELRLKMSEKRFNHTIMVEQMAITLGKIYAPSKITQLRTAALLHDVTKEFKTEKQLEIMQKFNYNLKPIYRCVPKSHHAITASLLIPVMYSQFADKTVIDAVRYHTTGKSNMNITEKIIYLADYIDLSRTFPDCITVRNYFFEKYKDSMTKKELSLLLLDTLILSFDMTIKNLTDEDSVIAPETINARNSLIIERIKTNESK